MSAYGCHLNRSTQHKYQGEKAWVLLARIAVVAGTFNIGLLVGAVLFADTG